jgi:hypothetical protein
MRKLSFFLAAMTALVFTTSFSSCAEDTGIENNKLVGDGSIRYGVQSSLTRGTATTASNYLDQITNFKVWGYFAPGATGSGVTEGACYIGTDATTGTIINGDGTGDWENATPSEVRYWPVTTAPLNFQAITPATDASFTVNAWPTASASDKLPRLTATVTIPTTVASQKDIMFAKQENVTAATNNQTANLTFNHALSQIVFSAKTANADVTASVTELSIVNVHAAGTVGFFGTDRALSSTVTDAASTTFSLGLDGTNSAAINSSVKNITALNGALLMLPQTVEKWQTTTTTPVSTTAANTAHNSYLKIKCTITANGFDVINDSYIYLPFEISWVQGNKYVYTLIFGGNGSGIFDEDGNLKASVAPVRYAVSYGTEWNEIDGTLPLDAYTLDIKNLGNGAGQISSYVAHADGTTEAVAWTAEYSTDGGSTWTASKPAWMSAFAGSGVGSVNYANITLHSGNSGGIDTSSSETDFDLSDPEGVGTPQNTANCYMVHKPGTYKLPLVYGNAIKNGSTNASAYTPGAVEGNKRKLVNHADAAITDPWLKNNSATPTSAELLWQDVNGLIKSGSIAIDGDYLKFEVDAAHAAEGNAVIAVKKSSDIVWSWHIWVTGETFATTTNITAGSHTYKVTPVNLGWVGSTTTNSIKVRFKQTGGDTKIIDVTQTISNPSAGGTNTYYQWGRKDAFLPAANMTSGTTTDKTAYNISGTTITGITKTNSTVSTGTAIKNPLVFYYKSSSPYKWETEEKYNNWDINDNAGNENTQAATVKTVYDPCPPGFCVPTSGLYYYIKSQTRPTFSAGYTYSGIFFPASGYRYNGSGVLSDVGSNGYYWSATPNYGTYGRSFYFNSSSWNLNYYYRTGGSPVRAVAE